MRNLHNIMGLVYLNCKGIIADLNLKKNKAIEKGYKTMQPNQNLMKYRLNQVNHELISYGKYQIGSLTKSTDTVMNLNNRMTAVDKEILNRTLCYDFV